MKKNTQGFTIIELLMVIAIIGLLSAIVLVTLNSARAKGADAAVKSDLVTVRTQAEVYFSNNSDSYGNFVAATCPVSVTAGSIFNDSNIVNAINSALGAGGSGTRCVATGNGYAVAVGMKTSGQSWCVDNTGQSKQYAGTPSAAISGTVCQ